MTTQKNIRVLIAEDDYLVGKNIRRAIESLDYQIVGEAKDGIQAIELACSLDPDVILMDIKMPGFDGLEATRQIQDLCPKPVVILTAYESKDLVDKASDVGVSSYLVKPAKSSEIKRAITIALARHKDLIKLRELNRKLKIALSEIKTLRGILPICSSCKKIRDDKGYWNQIESYFQEHSNLDFSHSICPDCIETLYPEYTKLEKNDKL